MRHTVPHLVNLLEIESLKDATMHLSCQAMSTVVNGCKEKAQWDTGGIKLGILFKLIF